MKDLLKLLQSIERKRPVGTLVLGRRGRSCDLFVEGDRLIYAGKEWSGRVDIEALGRSNLLGQRLSPSVLDAAISGTNLFQKPLPEALLERGIVTSEEWSALMASHLSEEIFSQAFRHAESFAFHESHVPEHLLDEDPRKAPLPIAALTDLLEKRAQTAAIVAQLIPSRKEVLIPTEKGMAHHKSGAADLGLQRIFDLIDGFRTLNELVRDVPFFEFYIFCRLVEALQAGHLKKTVLPEVKDVNVAKLGRAEAEQLLPAFKWAVKHAVDEIGAREKLATLYERLGQNEEAVIQYNFIGDALYRMKKLSRALKAFQRVLELHPGDPLVTDKVVKAYMDAAEEAVREGKRDVAFTLLNAAAKVRPDMLEITERILALSIEALDLRRVADLCEAVAERSRSVRDITPALKVLRTVVEKFPRERSYRKKLVNIYLDFGMNEEAVAELEELAELETQDGKTARVQEIWEKIVRIDPGREDIRKRLKGAARRAAARRLPTRRVPLLKTTLLFLLAVAGYQYWSYLELEPFRERRLAHGEGSGPRASGIERGEREEKLLALAQGVERFEKRFPLSLFGPEAGRLRKLYREEAGRMARDRDKLKKEILDQAAELAEKGQKEAAVKTLRRLLALPAGDPWRARAAEGIKRLDRYEKTADEILHAAEEAATAGDWENCYRLLRRLLDEHPLSQAALRVELPVQVRTIPEGALLKSAGAPLGPSPQRLRVQPGKPAEIQVEADGFLPLTERVPDDAGPERLLLLNRKPLWTVPAGKPLHFPPAIARDQVLLVRVDGGLSALSLDDGGARWSHAGGTVVAPVAAPLEVDGRIHLPLNDGQILQFTASGEVARRIVPQALISTPLLASGGALVFGTSQGAILGWDARENALAWTLPFKGTPARLVDLGAGQYLVSTEKGRLVLLDRQTGGVAWEASIGDKIVSEPVKTGDVIVVQTADHRLVSVDARTGGILARRSLSPPFKAAVQRGSGRVALLEGNEVVEIDPHGSRVTSRARLPLEATALHPLPGATGATLAGGGYLHLQAGSYKPLWGYRPAAGRVVHCTGGGATILIATDAGELIAFKDAN